MKKKGLAFFSLSPPTPVCFAHYPSLQVVDIPLRGPGKEKQLRLERSRIFPLCKLLNGTVAPPPPCFSPFEAPALFTLPSPPQGSPRFDAAEPEEDSARAGPMETGQSGVN